MKVRFLNLGDALSGALTVASDIGIEIVSTEEDVTVSVEELSCAELSVSLEGESAKIKYGGGRVKLFRGMAILAAWLREGKRSGFINEKPIFSLDGAMVDMSRNAVMNVKTVKFMLRKMALMGMNAFMLYTEDTYEIKDRPYFGYMRGRYTRDEIRELDEYALKLGIELIPCIQVLGHLATHLRWSYTAPYKDTQNALLVGADETYALIEDMFRTVSECFTSKRLHMGMDETHDLGTGAYLDKNGYASREDIYLSHLGRVVDIAKKYGFKPMMWSDMFYELSAKDGKRAYDTSIEITEDTVRRVPGGVQQVYWDYYHEDEDHYRQNIVKHRLLGKNTMFAGGIWMWSGHCPQFKRSLLYTPPALRACKAEGVREVIATVWHNGSESCPVMATAALAWYAGFDYCGSFDKEAIKKTFERACTDVRYDDIMAADIPEFPHGGKEGLTRAVLYNDPLIGLVDAHIKPYNMNEYYEKTSAELGRIDMGGSVFGYGFEVIRRLSSVLEKKANLGLRLKAAYDNKDEAALVSLALECGEITERIYDLREAHRTAWFEYNKPFGWEIHDIRYGGIVMRLDTVKKRIADYVSGKVSEIEELSAERLAFVGSADTADQNWRGYPGIASVSRFD